MTPLPPPHALLPLPDPRSPTPATLVWPRPAPGRIVAELGLPNPHDWTPHEADWHLPSGWQDTLHRALREQLDSSRELRLFMDGCVRCGACADACHAFLGTGDPHNMPVMRAELLRAVYRRDFTLAGRLLGRLSGGRRLDADTVKSWYAYFYQCTACRRCALFCPMGIDTAAITLHVRDMLLRIGLGPRQILEPALNCARTGNHLGLGPDTIKEIIETLCDDIAAITGVRIRVPINEKGHEVLFVAPSGDLFAEPGIYTFMGYLMLFQAVGLDYTVSTFASEGGNFGAFISPELGRRLNAHIYAEAERLGVRWILGGECGHMWRIIQQYMDTWNGPAPAKLITPVSPVTGTVFHRAASVKAVHIAEFTADLIRHNAVRFAPERNDPLIVTWHDSCNPARSMGLLDEPRAVLRAACNHFVEMPADTIRERTFCCGSGAGLHGEENMEWRLRAGFARGQALRTVRDQHGVNLMACMCALDRVTLPPVADYWSPGVAVCGLHELVGNALILPGEGPRTVNLRQEALPPPAATPGPTFHKEG